MNDVSTEESGLAYGLVNTSFMMGGALGLAVIASLADARTSALRAHGSDGLAALNEGYQLAFVAGALMTAAAAFGAFLLREKRGQAAERAAPIAG
jgi:hypothetical protein